jgi:CubicO group peptidase (beta-lactamase class C family)
MEDFATGKNVISLPRGVKEFTWQSKVKDILPWEWALMDEWADQQASFRDVLTHVSGLPR